MGWRRVAAGMAAGESGSVAPMRRGAIALGWAAVALAAGCEQPRTELVVRVDSELAWGPGQRVQSVVLTVRREGAVGPLRRARTTALGADGERRPLPLLVGVTAGDDTETPVWIEALGCGGPNGCTTATAVVAQRAVVRFALGQTQEVGLLLASACVGVSCGSEQRCAVGSGRCEAATRAQESVRPFSGSDAAAVAVVDAPEDAGRIADASSDVRPLVDRTTVDVVDVVTPADVVDVFDVMTPADVMADAVLPAEDGSIVCSTGRTLCGASCRDLSSDSNNCGACTRLCPSGQVCVAGMCSSTALYHGWTSPIVGCSTTGYTTTAPTALGGTYPYNTGDSAACRAWKLAATVCTTQPVAYSGSENWSCSRSGGFTDPTFGTYCLALNQYSCSTCPGACNAGPCRSSSNTLRNCSGIETAQP